MAVIERDVVNQGKDANGNETIDFPLVRLGWMEPTADVKEAPGANDYIPIVDGDDQDQMKKLPVSALAQSSGSVSSDQIGVPGGIATLDGDGKLTQSQRPTVDCYTQAQADGKIADAVSAHDGSDTAHPALQASIDAMEASIQAIELKYGPSVTENPFTVSFANLNDVVVTGVWNSAQARVEF